MECSHLLYRGISVDADERNDGTLRPKGCQSAVLMQRDGKVGARKGHFERVPSETNAVRAHHVECLYDTCWISFTRSESVARRFATNYGTTDGFVYIVDERFLAVHGVVAKEFPDPEHPGEAEVSLRAPDNGALPADIVIEKRKVLANDV